MTTEQNTVTADAQAAGVQNQKQTVATVTVQTKEFTKELEWAVRFAERKATIPILQNVAIRSNDGEISFTGTDLETAGVTSIDAEGDSFAITIPAHLALKYLKKVTDSELVLTVDGYKVTMKHGADSEVTLNGMAIESYPEIPVYMGMSDMNVYGLQAALPRILTSISDEESRFTLNGALLEIRDDSARIVSTDGNRLSLCELSVEWHTPQRAIIPRFALSELARLDADTVRFAADDNHVFLRVGRRTIVSRKLTGNFPDYERVMPRNHPHVATIDADALRKHGERVALFADERSHAMLFCMADSKLTISASGSDNGKAKAVVPTTWEVPEWATALKWDYVLDFLKLAPKTAFDMRFTTEHLVNGANASAIVFEVPGWTYVVMPMRI
jgi:DNA polymerase III subunit beta